MRKTTKKKASRKKASTSRKKTTKKKVASKKAAPAKKKSTGKGWGASAKKRTNPNTLGAMAKADKKKRGRKPLPASEAREYPVQIRFTFKEQKHLLTKCKPGQTLTGYMTELILKQVPTNLRRKE